MLRYKTFPIHFRKLTGQFSEGYRKNPISQHSLTGFNSAKYGKRSLVFGKKSVSDATDGSKSESIQQQ